MTRKWIEVNDLSGSQYSFNKNIRFKNLMLKSDFCGCTNAYIVVKGTADFLAAASNKKAKKKVAPSRSCI